MNSPIKYLYKGGSGEIVVKRSRFLATLTPVASEEEASAFIEAQKKLYWDARHNCQATVIGDNAEFTRCSDDGEPPHTAGRPMLDILLHEEIRNVCVVVTRYFGGILLGTGGLVRAYQDAVTEGLKNCVIAQKQRAVPVTVRLYRNRTNPAPHRGGRVSVPLCRLHGHRDRRLACPGGGMRCVPRRGSRRNPGPGGGLLRRFRMVFVR